MILGQDGHACGISFKVINGRVVGVTRRKIFHSMGPTRGKWGECNGLHIKFNGLYLCKSAYANERQRLKI
jgi:hypothetical protein